MRVLVAYASADGSTGEIAERIAGRLRGRGHEATAAPAGTVGGIATYDAVVLGSAVHGREWLDDATTFVQSHRGALAERPVWVFSVGMPDALPRVFRKLARTEEAAIVEHLDGLVTEGHRLFSGVVKPGQFPIQSRMFLRLLGGRYGDFRDWAGIDQWADDIARRLDRLPSRTSG